MSIVKYYPPLEEKLNVISHACGLFFGLVGLPFLLLSETASASWINWTGKLVFGTSMVVLYAASTFYHLTRTDRLRLKLRVFDHAAIYVLIAGTYTPFMLVTLGGGLGTGILIATWVMAVIGIVLKLFFTGHFSLLSTMLYVLMGWAIVLVIKPLAAGIDQVGLYWLVWGGISYTLGAFLYAIKKLPFNHALFHLFVVLGTVCHYICVLLYV